MQRKCYPKIISSCLLIWANPGLFYLFSFFSPSGIKLESYRPESAALSTRPPPWQHYHFIFRIVHYFHYNEIWQLCRWLSLLHFNRVNFNFNGVCSFFHQKYKNDASHLGTFLASSVLSCRDRQGRFPRFAPLFGCAPNIQGLFFFLAKKLKKYNGPIFGAQKNTWACKKCHVDN